MKIFLILIALAVIVAVGVVVYQQKFAPANDSDSGLETELQVNETTSVNDSGEFSGVGTLATLLSRNTNLECSLSYKPNDIEEAVTGSYFISDGRVRADFMVPAVELGGTMVTSMIMINGTTYIWSNINGQLYGTKTTQAPPSDAEVPTNNNSPVPEDVDVKYTCKPWAVVDNSLFEPPTNVIFQDTAKLMEAGMEYGTIYEEGELAPN